MEQYYTYTVYMYLYYNYFDLDQSYRGTPEAVMEDYLSSRGSVFGEIAEGKVEFRSYYNEYYHSPLKKYGGFLYFDEDHQRESTFYEEGSLY